MKNLKTYQMFESSLELTPEQVKWLDKCTDGTWRLNPQTGLVDVDGDFDCSRENLTDFNGARFGVVEGVFSCNYNQLTSLEGAPREVGGHFNCSGNQLTTLEGAPQEAGGHFNCSGNQLITLEGAPQEAGGHFNCSGNQLTSLDGAPREVGEDFNCVNNQLTTLEGSPLKVGGDFICYHNPVDNETLKSILKIMKSGKSYQEALESRWDKIPQEDRILLWRPEFKWVSQDEARALQALKAYQGIKGML